MRATRTYKRCGCGELRWQDRATGVWSCSCEHANPPPEPSWLFNDTLEPDPFTEHERRYKDSILAAFMMPEFDVQELQQAPGPPPNDVGKGRQR